MNDLDEILRTSLEADAARAPELPAEWRPRIEWDHQARGVRIRSRNAAPVLVGALALIAATGLGWAVISSQDQGDRVQTEGPTTPGVWEPPGEEFPLEDRGPATSLEARIGLPVVQELTRSLAVAGQPPLTVFTALTYGGGREAEELRCVAQGGSAACGPESGGRGPHVSTTASIDNGQADFDLWVWGNVGSGVEYVTYSDGDRHYWQSPVAGVVAFPDVPGDDEVVIGFSRDGVELARADHLTATAWEDGGHSARADISQTELEALISLTEDSLRGCLTDRGGEPVSPELVTLPGGVDVDQTWEVCAAQAKAAVVRQLGQMRVRFFDPATEAPLSPAISDDPGVEALADALGCDNRTHRTPDPGEPIQPLVAMDCLLGEGSVGIQTYESSGDRDQVIAYLHQFVGFRVVGDRWIIGVDTPEVAAEVADRTGGEIIELAGT